MERARWEHRSGRKGLLETLFGGQREEEQAPDGLEEGAHPETAEAPVSKAAPGPPPEIEIQTISALCELWLLWQPGEMPPRLCLEEGAPVEPALLEAEKAGLCKALEREAQERLRELAPLAETPEGAREEPRPLSAKSCIYVSRDKMTAWGLLLPPAGGGGIDPGELERALRKGGVIRGIDEEAVAELAGLGQYFQLKVLARGLPVVEGESGRIVEHYPRLKNREFQADAMGKVDYHAQNYIQNVKKGDILCDIIPLREGKAGFRVDGKEIKPRQVVPAKVPRGSNTTVSEGGTQLIASMDGQLEHSGSVLQIKPVLLIEGDVDYSTGNLDFRGDIHIRGDVREGFSVRATGTVTVDGLVEAAVIESGKDIFIGSGVLGDNKARLQGGGTVRARYLENCVVFSGTGVFAECIFSSKVYSDGFISVTGGRGTIIGGSVTAAHKIEARVIGSKAGRETAVTLGVYPYIQEELDGARRELLAITQEGAELARRIPYLEERQTKEGNGAKLAKAKLQKTVLDLKREKLLRRQQELKQTQTDLSKCRLECGTVYPVMKLTIGQAIREIREMWTRCTVVYDMTLEAIKFV